MTSRYRKLAPIILVLALASCGPQKSPTVTPTVTATQILQRVDEFQDTIIQLYSTNSISPEHALLYNKFCVLSAHALKELPNGWQATVKAAWTQLLTEIPLVSMEPNVQYTAKLVDALISAL